MDQKTHKFAIDFYNELEGNNTIVCSPVSAEIALALVALGSTNQTHAELLEALGFPDDDSIRVFIFHISSIVNNLKDTLNAETKFFLKKGEYEVKDSVKEDAEKVMIDLEQLDFGDRKSAADHINKWVAAQTNGKIKCIISGHGLTDVHILLLNAICFEGAWLKPFNSTTQHIFFANNETVIEVSMMMITDEFRIGHIDSLNAEILELQYTKEETSMVIVLPDEVEGLQELLQQLTAGHDLMGDIEGLSTQLVQVLMPKFTVETKVNLKKVLPKLGIKTIFDESLAEIDILTTPQQFCLSVAIQKAFIGVNEKGTETTAVNKMEPTNENGTNFKANHPLLFLLTIHNFANHLKYLPGDLDVQPKLTQETSKTDKEPTNENVRNFKADHPFLFLLICHHIPFLIGTYHG